MEQSLNNLRQSLRYDPDIFAFVEWRNFRQTETELNKELAELLNYKQYEIADSVIEAIKAEKDVIKTAILKEQNTKEG